MRKSFADVINTEALTKKYEAKDLSPFKVLRVQSVNFSPHPFTIGSRHVEYASDHCGGRLGNDVIEKFPCAATGCKLLAKEHTFDVVLMLQLTRNATNAECVAVLKPIGKEMEEDGIDGLTMVETPEKYRVSK